MAGFSNDVLYAMASSFTNSAPGTWNTYDDGTDTFQFCNNHGTPEGVISADTGSLCTDTTNGVLYIKTTDTVNTGWSALGSGGSVTINTPSGSVTGTTFNFLNGTDMDISATGTDITFNSTGAGGSAATGSLQYYATSGGSSLSGWLPCDGSIVAQATYTALFAQMGLINPPDSVFTMQNSLSNSPLATITYGNGIYLAAGAQESVNWIQTSTDAITWNVQLSSTNTLTGWSCSTYGGGLYVLGNANGLIITSTNGSTWTSQTSGTSTGITALLYANSTYVATLNGGATVLTSTDAVTWTAGKSPVTAFNQLSFGNSIFVAVGFGGNVATSTDAVTWDTKQPSVSKGQCLCFDGVKYVSANAPGVATSTDAITWTGRTLGSNSVSAALIYDGSTQYVLSTFGGGLLTSTDAITWASQTSGTTSSILCLAFGASTYVYAGAGGVLRTSTDAVTWTSRTSGIAQQINALTFGNSIFVYGGAGGQIYTSTDGITWTSRTSGTSSSVAALIYGSGPGLFVYTGNSGVCASSTDAITWVTRTSGLSANGTGCLAYGNGTFVIGGDMGFMSTSTNGTTWSVVASGYSNTIAALTYDGSNFIASIGASTGNTGGISTSPDGFTWTKHVSSGTLNSLTSIAFGGGIFVLGGFGGYLASTTDGVTITHRTSTFIIPSFSVTALAYGNGKFVLGTNTQSQSFSPQTMGTSTDGITWNQLNTNINSYGLQAPGSINGLVYGSRFVGCMNIAANTQLSNIIIGNSTYSYDTSTQFSLPTDSKIGITNEGLDSFPRKLYIKT